MTFMSQIEALHEIALHQTNYKRYQMYVAWLDSIK